MIARRIISVGSKKLELCLIIKEHTIEKSQYAVEVRGHWNFLGFGRLIYKIWSLTPGPKETLSQCLSDTILTDCISSCIELQYRMKNNAITCSSNSVWIILFFFWYEIYLKIDFRKLETWICRIE
jgi:hypothetical protein